MVDLDTSLPKLDAWLTFHLYSLTCRRFFDVSNLLCKCNYTIVWIIYRSYDIIRCETTANEYYQKLNAMSSNLIVFINIMYKINL